MREAFAAIGIALALCMGLASLAHADVAPRAVSLSDARRAPDTLVYLYPHQRVTPTQCAGSGYFTDTSAYTWRGGALSAQRWNRAHDRTFWSAPYGGRVVFDGVTFRNATARGVLVAGWCDD